MKKKLKFRKDDSIEHILYTVTFGLVGLTILTGIIFTSPLSSAITGNSEQSNVSVTVPNSCTMSGQIITPHTDTIPNGTLHNGIGSTKMKIYCNDTGGYTVYAIGSGNDEDGNTNMVSSLGSNDIATGSSTSGSTSSWAMQLTAGTGTGSITTPPTILDGYDSYHNIPGAYTAVARRSSATDMETDVDVTGSYFTTTYRVYVGSNQPAATYTGKVKYAVIHPYNGESTLTTLQDALAAASAPTTTGTDGNTYYALHGLTSTICNNATITGTNSVTKLADARDGNIYTVAKLADNKCWLLDNLRLDPTDSTTASNMNATNTHAPAEAITNYLNGSQTAPHDGWSTVAVADTDVDLYYYGKPQINNASVDTEVTGWGPAANNGKAKVGVYYNYCAATIGTYCYNQGAGIGDASYDVCPANWRMPTGGPNGEYQSLCTTLFGSECTNPTSMTATNANSLQSNLSTPLSGYYNGSQAYNRDSYGYFWSSTRYNGNVMHSLYVYSSSVGPQNDSYRLYGFPVRCVTGDSGNYMQEMDNAKLASLMPNVGDTTTLIDKRDSQKYMVGKLADGKYWLLENLRLDPTAVSPNMMKGNTNATNEAIDNYYHPTGTAPQSGWSTVAVEDVDTDFNSYNEPRINNASVNTEVTSYGPAAVNGKGKVGIYYNYCAATVGTYCYASGAAPAGVNASYDVCPANWRMPTGGPNGEYQSLCTTLFGSECTNPTSMAATNANSLQSNLSTPLSGNYYGSQANSRGSNGYFWSSTRNNGYNMYRLYVGSSSVYPQDDNNRGYGFSVRCLFGS